MDHKQISITALALCIVLLLATGITRLAYHPSKRSAVLPVGDPCIVGTWIDQKTTNNADFGDQTVSLVGLQGYKYTVTAQGVETDDYSGSRPLFGTYRGQSVQITITGRLVFHIHADHGHWAEIGSIQGSLQDKLFYNGRLIEPNPVSIPNELNQGTYSCSGRMLQETYPTSTESYTRQ